jgi:hypothetical protein
MSFVGWPDRRNPLPRGLVGLRRPISVKAGAERAPRLVFDAVRAADRAEAPHAEGVPHPRPTSGAVQPFFRTKPAARRWTDASASGSARPRPGAPAIRASVPFPPSCARIPPVHPKPSRSATARRPRSPVAAGASVRATWIDRARIHVPSRGRHPGSRRSRAGCARRWRNLVRETPPPRRWAQAHVGNT